MEAVWPEPKALFQRTYDNIKAEYVSTKQWMSSCGRGINIFFTYSIKTGGFALV